jgi:hypothetical protein
LGCYTAPGGARRSGPSRSWPELAPSWVNALEKGTRIFFETEKGEQINNKREKLIGKELKNKKWTKV